MSAHDFANLHPLTIAGILDNITNAERTIERMVAEDHQFIRETHKEWIMGDLKLIRGCLLRALGSEVEPTNTPHIGQPFPERVGAVKHREIELPTEEMV